MPPLKMNARERLQAVKQVMHLVKQAQMRLDTIGNPPEDVYRVHDSARLNPKDIVAQGLNQAEQMLTDWQHYEEDKLS